MHRLAQMLRSLIWPTHTQIDDAERLMCAAMVGIELQRSPQGSDRLRLTAGIGQRQTERCLGLGIGFTSYRLEHCDGSLRLASFGKAERQLSAHARRIDTAGERRPQRA